MPNRILKESICTSESIDGLTWFEECFFYRLIVNCDDYGRMDARVPILRSRLFPLKSLPDDQISDALKSLHNAGIVDLYSVEGHPYIQLHTWESHQSIRAKRSKYPTPDESNLHARESNCKQMHADESKCPRNPIQSESNPNPIQSPDLQSGNVTSVDEVFDKTYEIYPRKEGKAKGKANYINYLTKGRSISGQGRIKLNHQQIYIAVQAYAAAVCGTETRYIKNFEAFTNSTLLDYIEQTQEAYEAWMFEKYGNDWRDVKFRYTT